MDANFQLKNQLVSNYSQDPGLGMGWAYMIPRQPYESYVLSQANDEDISTCVGFQALAQANTKSTKGLRYTGVNGVFCGRSEMVLPMGLGNLQKGERYANMDFVFASSLREFLGLSLILISYDIACQWFINLSKRMKEHWPSDLRLPPTIKLIPAIPKLHEPMHETTNHQVYSLNFIPGVGKSDLETPERVWSAHNAIGNWSKVQGPGSRSDSVDDHLAFWNWLKYVSHGDFLLRKYMAALAERNIQREGHRGFTATLEKFLVVKWEAMCVAWEKDPFPKKKPNPYHTESAVITEAQVRKELAEEEQRRLADGGTSLHTTSAASFISIGLEIEDTQRRIRRLAKSASSQATARQEGGLIEQRNQLRTRIQGWGQLIPIYMPGLLQYKTTLPRGSYADDAENAEDVDLWFPSRVDCTARATVCVTNLPEMEEKLRTAQCFDSLDNVRTILTLKSCMVAFKSKNVRGQREGTRSRAVIDRVHKRARAAAEKYRASRRAKLALSGPGDWEQELQELLDADIRGYQDPDRLRRGPGRRGTLEDGQLQIADEEIDQAEGSDFTLFNEVRSRRDGTGETRRTISWIWRVRRQMAPPDTAANVHENANNTANKTADNTTNNTANINAENARKNTKKSTKKRANEANDEAIEDANNDTNNDILRSEWAKSRAHAARCQEEVLLIREEMRRTIAASTKTLRKA
ncbi:hypothetical protein NLJ89_g11723 [Agrocybe chaxingu]|uniref:Uncharacterized protein n=1 Tax=Agrocybe chaxingu TaxID=84603 RepID=A0A9W8JW92_9AGAR|nr:hypothetical protein NLJ89_g11723 [Agrocybe chaxingu]